MAHLGSQFQRDCSPSHWEDKVALSAGFHGSRERELDLNQVMGTSVKGTLLGRDLLPPARGHFLKVLQP